MVYNAALCGSPQHQGIPLRDSVAATSAATAPQLEAMPPTPALAADLDSNTAAVQSKIPACVTLLNSCGIGKLCLARRAAPIGELQGWECCGRCRRRARGGQAEQYRLLLDTIRARSLCLIHLQAATPTKLVQVTAQ